MKYLYFLALIPLFAIARLSFIDQANTPAFFADNFYWNPIGRQELCSLITPLLQEHLRTTNYNRLSLTLQYIHHYQDEQNKNRSVRPLDALTSFIPDLSLGELKGSSCHGLNVEFLSKIPSSIRAYSIPATLLSSSQQPYWPTLAHVAIVIPFINPNLPEDRGYILLDPHLKIPSPNVIELSSLPQMKNCIKTGLLSFFYEQDRIILMGVRKQLQSTYAVLYYLQEFTDFIGTELKSILATDRKITMYSRTEEGAVIASLILLLDTNTIQYKIQDHPLQEISFSDFLSQKVLLQDTLAKALHVEEKTLNTHIREILLHKNLLDDLYQEYTESFHKNFENRSCEGSWEINIIEC